MTITLLTELAEAILEHNKHNQENPNETRKTPFNAEHIKTISDCIGNPRKRNAFIDYVMGWTSKERFINDIQ